MDSILLLFLTTEIHRVSLKNLNQLGMDSILKRYYGTGINTGEHGLKKNLFRLRRDTNNNFLIYFFFRVYSVPFRGKLLSLSIIGNYSTQ
jgi:hypothetical protein